MRLLLVSALALAAAGCSSGEGGYPASAEATFTSACVAQPGATAAGCECLFREVEERLSYEEFRRVDTAILIGEEVEGDEGRAVLDALGECRDESAAGGRQSDESSAGMSTGSEGDGLREADEELEAEEYFGEGGVAECGGVEEPYLTAEKVRQRLEEAGYTVLARKPSDADAAVRVEESLHAVTPSGFLAVALFETPEAAASFLTENVTSDYQAACVGNRVYLGVGGIQGGPKVLPDNEFIEAMLTAEGRR